MKIKKSSNYPINSKCDVCWHLDQMATPAWYDMPINLLGRVQWAHVCKDHAEQFATAGGWSLGTQIAGPID